MAFFDANFVVGNTRYAKVDEKLLHCMRVLGLAAFSGVARSPSVLDAAMKHYVVAIGGTNAALRSPVQAKEDCTLLAVIMLGILETVAGSGRSCMSA